MAVERIYSCSLCRDRYDVDKLHGIWWTCKKEFRKVPSRESEHHLCQGCLDSAAAMAAEYNAMRPQIENAYEPTEEQE